MSTGSTKSSLSSSSVSSTIARSPLEERRCFFSESQPFEIENYDERDASFVNLIFSFAIQHQDILKRASTATSASDSSSSKSTKPNGSADSSIAAPASFTYKSSSSYEPPFQYHEQKVTQWIFPCLVALYMSLKPQSVGVTEYEYSSAGGAGGDMIPYHCNFVMAESALTKTRNEFGDAASADASSFTPMWGIFSLRDLSEGDEVPLLSWMDVSIIEGRDNGARSIFDDYSWAFDMYSSLVPGIGRLLTVKQSGDSNEVSQLSSQSVFQPNVSLNPSDPGNHRNKMMLYVSYSLVAGTEILLDTTSLQRHNPQYEHSDSANKDVNARDNGRRTKAQRSVPSESSASLSITDSMSTPHRSIQWLRRNGICLDHLQLIQKATRKGAFSIYSEGESVVLTRDVAAGSVLAPIPIKAQRRTETSGSRQSYHHSQCQHKRCFGHHNSSVILVPFPLPMANAIVDTMKLHRVRHPNYNTTETQHPNAALRWSKKFLKLSDTTTRRSPFGASSSFPAFTDTTRENQRLSSLLLDVVAIRDLRPNEPLIIDMHRSYDNYLDSQRKYESTEDETVPFGDVEFIKLPKDLFLSQWFDLSVE